MILDATSKSIEIILSSSVTTNQLPCFASYADITTTAFTPGSNDTQSNNTTAVTLVAAPAASTQRQVKSITVYNADTANAIVTVRLNHSSTYRQLVLITLLPGQTLQYGENSWTVIDKNGNILQATQINAAGAANEIQFNNGGTALGGDADLTWNTSANTMTLGNTGSQPSIQIAGSTTAPSIPPSGSVSIFGRSVANRMMIGQVGPSGLDTAIQPFMARNKVGYWCPPGNAATLPGVFGITALTAQGTATSRTVANTSLATRMRRLGYPSSATAGTFAGARLPVAQFSCGSGSYDGSGFMLVERWVESDPAVVSGKRAFHGMTSTTTAFANVEVNTLLNQVGICQLSTDATQWYWMVSGSTAQSATAIGTGIGAPGGNSTTAWELAIFAPNGVANTFYMQLTNITTETVVTVTYNLAAAAQPQSSTLLAWNAWATNNATAAAVGIDICSLYVETDN